MDKNINFDVILKNKEILGKSRDCMIEIFLYLGQDELYQIQTACKYFYVKIVPELMYRNKIYVIVMPPRSILNKDARFSYRGQFLPKFAEIDIRANEDNENSNVVGKYIGYYIEKDGKKVKQGLGQEIYNSGFTYEGQFFNGERHGVGRQFYQNDTGYYGQYQNGLKHGLGIQTEANGNFFTGKFKKGNKDGKGTQEKDGRITYQGGWLNGRKHG